MTLDDLLALLRDEFGLPLTLEEADVPFDDLAGWDSMHLLWLLTVIERDTGRRLSLPDMLEAGSLQQLYDRSIAS
jgi:acyl carrier protein